MATGTDAWVERWLSADRFATYLAVANGDRARALRLYEWNLAVSGALFHDLAHLEIGLRNAYDRALATAGPPPWTASASPLFASGGRGAAGGADVNARLRQQLAEARRNARQRGGLGPAHGDVVAQLGFGFWRYLTAKAHEKALWVPYLHRAFPPGTDRRRDVDEPLTRLHRTRNRIAHHEPLLRVDLVGRVEDVVVLATLVDQEVGRYVRANSATAAHIARRP